MGLLFLSLRKIRILKTGSESVPGIVRIGSPDPVLKITPVANRKWPGIGQNGEIFESLNNPID
jgi:hypothetical protein